MRIGRKAGPDVNALRARQHTHDQLKDLMGHPGWDLLAKGWDEELGRAAAGACRPPGAEERSEHRWYSIGYWHGFRAAATLVARLVDSSTLTDEQKGDLSAGETQGREG